MEQLTLDGAIGHLNNVLENKQWDCEECKNDHIALKGYLEELKQYKDAEENGLLVRLPCKVGSTVWVSPNNGESFHTGKLYGMNENGSYLVFVDDKVRDFVDFPFERKAIYDWFFKIYTREEAEQALKERAGK